MSISLMSFIVRTQIFVRITYKAKKKYLEDTAYFHIESSTKIPLRKQAYSNTLKILPPKMKIFR